MIQALIEQPIIIIAVIIIKQKYSKFIKQNSDFSIHFVIFRATQ
jgi:hypothetical protein